MTWQFNLYAIPILIVSIVFGGFAVAAWPRREQAYTRWFILLMVGLIAFALPYALELFSTDLAVVYALDVLSVSFGILSVPFVLFFILSYAGYDHLLTRRNLVLLFVVPMIYVGFMWTDGFHHQYIAYRGLIEIDGLLFLDLELVFTPFLVIGLLYFLSMQLASAMLLLYLIPRARHQIRMQYIFFLLALLPTLFATLVDTLDISPFPQIHTHLLMLCVACVPMAWSLFYHRLLDIGPAAYDLVIRSIPDAVVILDIRDRVIEVNPAALVILRSPDHQVIGKSVQEVFAALPDFVEHLRGQTDIQQELAVGKGDEQRQYSLRMSPLRNRVGEPGGRVVLIRDMTDARRAERHALQLQLQQQQIQLLQNFIRDVSHDFKTPITVMRSSAHLLQRYTQRLETQIAQIDSQAVADAPLHQQVELVGPSVMSIREKASNIDQNAIHLNTLLDEMMEMLRLDQPDALKLCLNDLNRVIEPVVRAFRPESVERGVTLNYEADLSLPPFLVDDIELPRAVSHLLKNALTHTPAGGSIHLTTAHDDNWARLTVSDTGSGIHPSDLPHIFERFYRADKARSTGKGGSGLGLSIVRRIVEGHAGTVEVHSQLGVGSTFSVSLPLRKAQPEPTAPLTSLDHA